MSGRRDFHRARRFFSEGMDRDLDRFIEQIWEWLNRPETRQRYGLEEVDFTSSGLFIGDSLAQLSVLFKRVGGGYMIYTHVNQLTPTSVMEWAEMADSIDRLRVRDVNDPEKFIQALKRPMEEYLT